MRETNTFASAMNPMSSPTVYYDFSSSSGQPFEPYRSLIHPGYYNVGGGGELGMGLHPLLQQPPLPATSTPSSFTSSHTQPVMSQATKAYENNDINGQSNTVDNQQQPSQRNPFISRSLCAVCNDKARGCNFGAITCASCKEFFRRNAFKSEKLKCYFQSKCEINVFSRRFCAACRLLKCYMIGMKSDYIMSEQEKSERQAKIMERKQSTTSKPRLEFEHENETLVDSMLQQELKSKVVKLDEPMNIGQSMLNSFEQMANFNSFDRRILEETNPLANIKEEFMSSDASHDYDLEQFFQPTTTSNAHTTSGDFSYSSVTSSLMNSTMDFTSGTGMIMSSYATAATPTKFDDLSTTLPTPAQPLQSLELTSTSPALPTTAITTHTPTLTNSTSNGDDLMHEEEQLDELAESETMLKLLRKVKIIRESIFYQTKYCLLLRARSSNKCMMHLDHCKLKYLTKIVQIMQAETIQELPTDQKHIDLLRLAEILTFNFIKLCKKLYAFQMLSQEDQVALVKGGVMETLIMWSIMNINLEKECWEAMDLSRNFKFSLKLELLKEANPKLFEEHRKYALSFEPEWRFDDTLMSLLVVITLFNDGRPKLKNVDQVRKTHKCFTRLLRTYLETLYDDDLIEEVFNRLMRQVEATEEISEFHVKAYFDVNANEVTRRGLGAVIMEIFDLNN